MILRIKQVSVSYLMKETINKNIKEITKMIYIESPHLRGRMMLWYITITKTILR